MINKSIYLCYFLVYSVVILSKNGQLTCYKAICVFSKKYDLFLINIVIKYKIKQKRVQYVGERGRDGVRKELIRMGHNKLIRLGTPKYL